MDAPQLVRTAWNFADRAYLFFFVAVSGLILLGRSHVGAPAVLLLVNIISIAIIYLLVRLAPGSTDWGFFHDWYPVAVPIITFEEISRLSLILRSGWQDRYILTFESRLF